MVRGVGGEEGGKYRVEGEKQSGAYMGNRTVSASLLDGNIGPG